MIGQNVFLYHLEKYIFFFNQIRSTKSFLEEKTLQKFELNSLSNIPVK